MHIARTTVLFLSLGLLACQPAPTPTQPAAAAVAGDEPLLRTYTVPPEQARSIRRALQSALSTGKDLPPVGTIEELPNGQLVVVAPIGIHDGIAELVRGLGTVEAAVANTAELDYWVIVGEAGGEGGLDMPEIAPALAAIQRERGPMKFTLLEQARVATLIDESARVEGNRIEVRQVVTEVGGRLVADIDLDVNTAPAVEGITRCIGAACKHFRTRVNLAQGQLLVVGQTGLDAPAEASRSLFYVVRGRTLAGG